MIFKKKGTFLTVFLIINLLILLHIKNNQNSSFRYFIWNIEEISIGKLISISFGTGFLLSSILTMTINKNILNYSNKDDYEKKEYDEKPLNNTDFKNPNLEMPPQRDIRDAQPTISVNYRVVKNNGEKDGYYDENFIEDSRYKDDWTNDISDWK